MNQFEKMGQSLLKGENGQKLRSLAQTPEAQKIGKMVDTEALRAAAESGDTETVKNVLAGVLATDEGKRIAALLGSLMGK